MKGLKRICAVWISIIAATPAWAKDYRLQFVPSHTKTIPDLKWDESNETQFPLLQMRAKGEEGHPYFVELQGRYLNPNIKLLLFSAKHQSTRLNQGKVAPDENVKIQIGREGKFTIEVGIEADSQEFVINEIDATGKIAEHSATVLFPEWNELLESQGKKPEKTLKFSPGLGFSTITFSQVDTSQASTTSFTQIGLTLSSKVEYTLKKFSFLGDAYFTLLPIMSTQSSNTLRQFGFHLAAGWKVPWPSSDAWRFMLIGGYSYRTTLTSQNTFGYQNIHSPELYPMLERKFSGGKLLWGYAKFSPIFNGGGPIASLSNFEFSSGLGYQFAPFENGHALSLSLDVSLLSLQYSGGFVGSINCNSYTVGANYSF